jgi:hypothetical protein
MKKSLSVIVTSNYRHKYSVGNAVGIKRISGSVHWMIFALITTTHWNALTKEHEFIFLVFLVFLDNECRGVRDVE